MFFLVYGFDFKLGFVESCLYIIGFVYGMFGILMVFLFMIWVFIWDWLIIFGGKFYFFVLVFILIIFELMVLFVVVGMVVIFYIICGFGLGVIILMLDDCIIDDKFCIVFDVMNVEEFLIEKLKGFFL